MQLLLVDRTAPKRFKQDGKLIAGHAWVLDEPIGQVVAIVAAGRQVEDDDANALARFQ